VVALGQSVEALAVVPVELVALELLRVLLEVL
jgi:hypothetical protein